MNLFFRFSHDYSPFIGITFYINKWSLEFRGSYLQNIIKIIFQIKKEENETT